MRPCVFGTCMWICSCVTCSWTSLMEAVLAISINMFNHGSFLCANVFGICAPPSTAWVLGNYAHIHHCCDTCLLVAHEFLKIQHWLHVLRFVSEIHICSCYLNLFLHAFHWSSWKTFFCCYETRGYNLQKQTNQYIDKVTQTYQPNVRYRKHFNM